MDHILNGARKVETLHVMVISDVHETANLLMGKVLAGLKDQTMLARSSNTIDLHIIAYEKIMVSKFQTFDHSGRHIRAQMI